MLARVSAPVQRAAVSTPYTPLPTPKPKPICAAASTCCLSAVTHLFLSTVTVATVTVLPSAPSVVGGGGEQLARPSMLARVSAPVQRAAVSTSDLKPNLHPQAVYTLNPALHLTT